MQAYSHKVLTSHNPDSHHNKLPVPICDDKMTMHWNKELRTAGYKAPSDKMFFSLQSYNTKIILLEMEEIIYLIVQLLFGHKKVKGPKIII